MTVTMPTTTREALLRRGLLLAYFTIVWDVVEGLIAVTAGVIANSIALIGFGLDSAIEVFASIIVVWQLRQPNSAARHRLALRLIACTFWMLGLYVGFESVSRLLEREHPEPSIVGIAMNVIALLVMIPLARMKRKTGEALGSEVLVADSAETRLSNYLSVNVLAGLALNAALGWWWADPVAAVGIAAFSLWTGWHTWSEAGPRREVGSNRSVRA